MNRTSNPETNMRLFLLVAILAFPDLGVAGDYWVDGRKGKDLPTHGSSSAKPWKTLAYALGRIPVPSTGAHTLWVAGGQTYSVATNGESFPLFAVPGVAIVGTGVRPTLAIPDAGTGVSFVGMTAYDHRSRLHNLAFQGGGLGVYSPPGTRHGPVISECDFRGQKSAGVYVRLVRESVADPVVRRCAFVGCAAGIFVETREHTRLARLDLEVEDCVFRDIKEYGVRLLVDGTAHSRIDVDVTTSLFERVGYGFYLMGVESGLDTKVDARLAGCAFRSCGVGIWTNAFRGLYTDLTVDACSILGTRSQEGMILSIAEGKLRVTLRDNYVRGCRSACSFSGGMSVPGTSLASATVFTRRNTAEACQWGFAGRFYNCDVDWQSHGDRAFGNGTGFGVWTNSPLFWGPGTVRVGSAILADNTDGLVCDTKLIVQGGGLTVAGNSRFGLVFANGGTGSAFESCIFSDNGTEVSGTVPITFSVFKQMSYAGTGNRKIDPLLIRPFFKIGSNSPCRDRGRNALLFPALDYEGDPRLGWPDIGADEYVASGSVRAYGVAGFGAFGMRPKIHSPNLAAPIGKDLHVDVRDAVDRRGQSAQFAALLVGTTDSPLPFDLALLGAPSSLAWHDLGVMLTPIPVSPAGIASLTARIPVAKQLVGTVTTLQWVVSKRDANPAGFVTTDALRVTIGDNL